MRQVREVLRLKLGAGLSIREIARRLVLAPSTVIRVTLERLAAAGLSWPLPQPLSDAGGCGAAAAGALPRSAAPRAGDANRPVDRAASTDDGGYPLVH